MDTWRGRGWLWIVAGVAWATTGLSGLSAADGSPAFYASEVAWVVVHVLVLVGIVGLLRADLVGRSVWGRGGLRLAAVGRVLFICFELAAIVQGTDELPVFPVAVISTGIGMLVGGVAIARGRRWSGCGRFAPLSVGAYPFLFIVPLFAATGSRPPDAVVAGWGISLVLVGLALAVRAPSSSPVQGAPARPPATISVR